MNGLFLFHVTFFFTISLFLDVQIKILCFNNFFLIETNFYVTPPPKTIPISHGPEKV